MKIMPITGVIITRILSLTLALSPIISNGEVDVGGSVERLNAIVEEGVVAISLSVEGDATRTYRFIIDPTSHKTILPRRLLCCICDTQQHFIEKLDQTIELNNNCKTLGVPTQEGFKTVLGSYEKLGWGQLENLGDDDLFDQVYGKDVYGVLGSDFLCNKTLYVNHGKGKARVFYDSVSVIGSEDSIPVFFFPKVSSYSVNASTCRGYPFVTFPLLGAKGYEEFQDSTSFGFFITPTFGKGLIQPLYFDHKLAREYRQFFFDREKMHGSVRFATSNKRHTGIYLLRIEESGAGFMEDKFLLSYALNTTGWDKSPIIPVVYNENKEVTFNKQAVSKMKAVREINEKNLGPFKIPAALDLHSFYTEYSLDLNKRQLTGIKRK